MLDTDPQQATLTASATLTPAPWNPRTIKDSRFQQLCRSLEADPDFLWRRPILAMADGTVYAGNMRLRAALNLGWREVPAIVEDVPEQLAKERAIRDNNSFGDWQEQELSEILESLGQSGVDLEALGFDDGALEAILASVGIGDATGPDVGSSGEKPATLADRFVVPPFSVLDARQGYWQERKRQWLALGIQSEIGRGANVGAIPPKEADLLSASYRDNGLLGFSEQARTHYREGSDGGGPNATPGGSLRPAATLGKNGKTVRGDGRGRAMMASTPPHGPTVRQNPDGTLNYNPPNPKYTRNHEEGLSEPQSGTSIFDPVLCELAYRWFSPPDGAVLDPFAGGSVRGIVASVLGRSYTGLDLSERQIEANREQAAIITPNRQPTWHVGDSLRINELAPGEYDLLFSCPPYGDLERYSDDDRDISTMAYADFIAVYAQIIAASASQLKPDRFACFVVGDIRDPKGIYRNFVSDTIRCFQDAGLRLYNDAILVTAVGSLPIRVGKQFSSGRKLGKTHQNVLVFVNGDPRKATEACGPVEVADLAEMFGEAINDD